MKEGRLLCKSACCVTLEHMSDLSEHGASSFCSLSLAPFISMEAVSVPPARMTSLGPSQACLCPIAAAGREGSKSRWLLRVAGGFVILRSLKWVCPDFLKLFNFLTKHKSEQFSLGE